MSKLCCWCSLAVLAACAGAPKPEAPVAAPDPGLVAVLAEIDKALAARPDDGVLLYQRASIMLAVGGSSAEALQVLARLDATGWGIPLDDGYFRRLVQTAGHQALAERVA